MNPSSSTTKTTTATILALLTLFAALPAFAAETNAAHVVPDDGVLFLSTARDGQVIWDLSRVPDREKTNLEFPYLIRFRDRWFCSFREGDRHGNDPSGRARIITSADGREWETAALLEWEGGDIRDPRMSVTPDGQLMLNSSIYFIGEQKENPADWEVPGKRQSVTWLSKDGRAWTGPYTCPTAFDTWLWDVAWHDGYGYSAGYAGKDRRRGTLYRTKDGKNWEVWVENFFDGRGTEAALAFGADGTGYCLLRAGGFYGKFAVGQAPDYKKWTWQDMRIDASGNGQLESWATFRKRNGRNFVGGQKLLRLSDGRLVAVTGKGGVDLFWVDPKRSLFTRFMRLPDGKTYPGLAEHEGELWITNSKRVEGGSVKSGICLVRVEIPPPASLNRLLEVSDEILSIDLNGFGRRYRDALRAVRADVAGMVDGAADAWDARTRLRKALADYREARELNEMARSRLAAIRQEASKGTHKAPIGFVPAYRERLVSRCEPLQQLLATARAAVSEVRKELAELDAAATALDDATRAHARAVAALADASVLRNETVTGFAHLYQAQMGECADRLRIVMGTAVSTDVVRERIEKLLDAASLYRRVDRDVPVRVQEVNQLPAAIVWATAADWSRGLRIDASVSNDTLVPSHTQALLFGDGKKTYVRVGNPPEIAALNDSLTFAAWVYPKSTDASYRTVLDKGGNMAIRQARTGGRHQLNAVSVRMYAEAEPPPHDPYRALYRPSDPAAFDHRWHHYAATYDGESLRLYIDGMLADALPKKGRADLLDGDLVFGCMANYREPWVGYIADVEIWSEALSGTRIAAQARRGIQGDEKGLVGYWPLNEGEGQIARDISGSENEGQIGGGVWGVIPVRRGLRISQPIRLDVGLNISKCTLEWEAEVGGDPVVDGVQVFYGISANEQALPEEWHEAANGSAVAVDPGLSTLAGRCLWLKQVLTTDDPASAPRLRRLTLRVRE